MEEEEEKERSKKEETTKQEKEELLKNDIDIKDNKDEGEISMILLLHCHNAEVNAMDKYGQTPLHFAAMTGNLEAAKDLVNTCKADVEVRKDREGRDKGREGWKAVSLPPPT